MGRRNTVALVRQMQSLDYKQKQIKLVTKLPQSTLSRIMNNQTYVTIKPQHYDLDPVLDKRLETLDRILKHGEIAGGMGLDDENKKYIKLLQYLGVNSSQITEMYFDVSKKLIHDELHNNNVDFREFNVEKIGVEEKDFKELIE